MRLWHMREQRRVLSSVLLVVAGAGTLTFQIWVASQYTSTLWWIAPSVLLLVIGAVLLFRRGLIARKTVIAGFACVVIAMTAVPAAWAGLTTLNNAVNTVLPHAYEGRLNFAGPAVAGALGGVNADLLAYLEAHTQHTRYLMAVSSSGQGDPYVLETGRPVLFMGGFTGNDPIIDAAGLQHLVEAGELRYVLWNEDRGRGNNADIGAWLQSTCSVVNSVSQPNSTLYLCGV
jgi:hypothetical protein